MKRITCCIALAIVFMLATAATGSAADSVPPEVQAVAEQQFPQVAQEIAADPTAWNLPSASSVPVSLGDPYKVEVLDPSALALLATDYSRGELVSALHENCWEYPLLSSDGATVQTLQVYKETNEWALQGFGLFLPTDAVALFSDPAAMVERLRLQPGAGAGFLRHARVSALNCDVIFLGSGSDDFAAVFSTSDPGLGLELEKAYPAGDVLQAMAAAIAATPDEAGLEGGVGGVAETPSSNTDLLWLAAAAAIVTVGISVWVWRARSSSER